MTYRLKKNQSAKRVVGVIGKGVACYIPLKSTHELRLNFLFHYHIIYTAESLSLPRKSVGKSGKQVSA